MNICSVPGCGRYVEGTTKYCGTHGKMFRKLEEEKDKVEVKRQQIYEAPRLSRRSPERAAEERRYNERVRVWLRGKRCAVFPEKMATQCHHKKGRDGRLLLYEPYWLPVSAAGHKKIHDEPGWALDNGFRILRSISDPADL